MKDVLTKLPRTPAEVKMVVARIRSIYVSRTDYCMKVRKEKVLDALKWLCENNKIYLERGITICPERLELIPTDDNLLNLIPSFQK